MFYLVSSTTLLEKENKKYVRQFKRIYSIDLNTIQASDAEVDAVYEALAKAIASFEKSRVFKKFNSKFDYEDAGITAYNEYDL